MTDKQPLAGLWELIRGIRIAMVTTVRGDGSLRSRPMATQEAEPDNVLWFATDAESAVVAEIDANPQVVLSYAAPEKDLYVTVSGRGSIVQDPRKAQELWCTELQAWYPSGPGDRRLRLVRIELTVGEYWLDRKPKALQLAQLLKAVVSGTRAPENRDNEKLDF